MEEQREDLNEPLDATINLSSSHTNLLEVVGDSERVITTANNESSTFVHVLTSGQLFRILTKGTGLWNVHSRSYKVLYVLFIVLNVLSVATETLLLTICGSRGQRCVSGGVTDTTNLDNNNLTEFRKFVAIIEVMYIWNGCASTSTLILIIRSLWKLQEKFPFMSIDAAQRRVSGKEWLFINLMLVICVVGFIVAVVYHVSLHAHDGKLKTYLSFDCTIFIIFWSGMFCCSIFVVVCCAMNGLVTDCFEDILKAIDGNLNTMIALHQKLRHKLFSISSIFSLWFSVHWIMFGVNSLSFLAFYSIKYSVLLSDQTVAIEVFVFVLAITIFVVPCISASRVTWKCKELLYKISNRRLEDWDEQHAFWDRATLNHFILYAERSECGFRVANFTFDAKGAWISVLLGITGLVLKLVAFSENMD